MPDPTVTYGDVQGFVRERLARITRRLPEGDEAISDATMREVRFLSELTKLAADTPVPQARRYPIIPALLALTVVCITALVFVRLPTIRVDMDVLCSGLRFRTPTPIELTGVSAMSLLEANELSPVILENPETLETTQVGGPIELRPDNAGALTLSSVTIPAGATVSLLTTANPGTWRLEIEHRDAAISATARGRMQVAGHEYARSFDFGRGSPILLRATRTEAPRLGLFLTPQRAESLLTSSLIPVEQIAFEEPVQSASPGVAGVTRGDTSSVIVGSVFNVSLGGRELALRKRDAVQISVASGYMRELRLEAEGLRVSLTADARELLVGRAGGLQSLRPSYLEWLAQRHGLQLAWGSAAWMFGLLVGGVKWWQEANA
jgi:hypothetical protein